MENEEQVYQVYIYLSPHPDRAHILQETFPTLQEAYEAAALEALTELCERHSGDLESAPASYLPVHYQADGPWRVRHQRMIEFQAEIDGFPARYGRDVTRGQLATTAEYALNIFNLQQDQRLEIQHLKQQVGQLQAANTALRSRWKPCKNRMRICRTRWLNLIQLVDDAIAMEEDIRLHHLEKKRARSIAGPSGSMP